MQSYNITNTSFSKTATMHGSALILQNFHCFRILELIGTARPNLQYCQISSPVFRHTVVNSSSNKKVKCATVL